MGSYLWLWHLAHPIVSPIQTFIVVSTLEAAPAHEAEYLARELVARRHHLGAIIANRVLPPAITRRTAAASARRLVEAADDTSIADQLASSLSGNGRNVDGRIVADVLREVGTRFHDVAVVATREAERRAELADLAPHVFDAPSLDSDVHDLASLFTLVEHLRT